MRKQNCWGERDKEERWVTSNVFYNTNVLPIELYKQQMPHKVNIQSSVLVFNKEEVNDWWMVTCGLPGCLNTGQYNALENTGQQQYL